MRDNAPPGVLWLVQRQVPALTHQTPFHHAQVLCFKDHSQDRHLPRQGWHRVGSSATPLPHQPLGSSHQRKLPQLLQQINSLCEEKQPIIICCLSFHTMHEESCLLGSEEEGELSC